MPGVGSGSKERHRGVRYPSGRKPRTKSAVKKKHLKVWYKNAGKSPPV